MGSAFSTVAHGLKGRPNSQMALSLDVGLVAQSGLRVRCIASISAGHVVDATVVVEEKPGGAPRRTLIVGATGGALARAAPPVDAVDRGNDPAGRRRAAPRRRFPIACVDNRQRDGPVVHARRRCVTRAYDNGALVAISLQTRIAARDWWRH